MKKGGAILKDDLDGWAKKAVEVPNKELESRLAELREVPFSAIVIETGACHYGLPPDAKERRM